MRTIVFVDYWNLQLSLQREESRHLQLADAAARMHRFHIDWYHLGPQLTRLATDHAARQRLPLVFAQTRIYTSANPAEDSFRNWAVNALGHQPGTHVTCVDRRPRWTPACPSCHLLMTVCPHCRSAVNTLETSINLVMATDMLGLGLGHDYDAALLVSQDADLGPVADCLLDKGLTVIQAGIGVQGKGLSGHCWAEFDLFRYRDSIRRPYRRPALANLYEPAGGAGHYAPAQALKPLRRQANTS